MLFDRVAQDGPRKDDCERAEKEVAAYFREKGCTVKDDYGPGHYYDLRVTYPDGRTLCVDVKSYNKTHEKTTGELWVKAKHALYFALCNVLEGELESQVEHWFITCTPLAWYAWQPPKAPMSTLGFEPSKDGTEEWNIVVPIDQMKRIKRIK